MAARFILRREEAGIREALKGFLGVCGLVLVCLLASSGPVVAQANEPEAPEATPAADLVNPAIPTEELSYRLVPLTKDELDPLARAWLKVVRSKTGEIADRKVELLRDPSAATDAAYQAIARMTEERAGLFERLTMVVNGLESKGGDEELVTELRAYRDSVFLSETRLASPKAIAIAFLTWLTRADAGWRSQWMSGWLFWRFWHCFSCPGLPGA